MKQSSTVEQLSELHDLESAFQKDNAPPKPKHQMLEGMIDGQLVDGSQVGGWVHSAASSSPVQ